jgi:hypothetical protein
MTAVDSEPGEGVLVISVWREDDTVEGFRARLVYGSDSAPDAVSQVATRPDDVVAAVATWLDRVAHEV